MTYHLITYLTTCGTDSWNFAPSFNVVQRWSWLEHSAFSSPRSFGCGKLKNSVFNSGSKEIQVKFLAATLGKTPAKVLYFWNLKDVLQRINWHKHTHIRQNDMFLHVFASSHFQMEHLQNNRTLNEQRGDAPSLVSLGAEIGIGENWEESIEGSIGHISKKKVSRWISSNTGNRSVSGDTLFFSSIDPRLCKCLLTSAVPLPNRPQLNRHPWRFHSWSHQRLWTLKEAPVANRSDPNVLYPIQNVWERMGTEMKMGCQSSFRLETFVLRTTCTAYWHLCWYGQISILDFISHSKGHMP